MKTSRKKVERQKRKTSMQLKLKIGVKKANGVSDATMPDVLPGDLLDVANDVVTKLS